MSLYLCEQQSGGRFKASPTTTHFPFLDFLPPFFIPVVVPAPHKFRPIILLSTFSPATLALVAVEILTAWDNLSDESSHLPVSESLSCRSPPLNPDLMSLLIPRDPPSLPLESLISLLLIFTTNVSSSKYDAPGLLSQSCKIRSMIWSSSAEKGPFFFCCLESVV